MKTMDMVAIGTIAMVACLLFCTPALANYNSNGFPVVTRASGTVNGGVFIDSVPWDGQATLTGNFNVPTGDITGAYLYTGIWGARPEYEGWVNVTFNGDYNSNGLGPIHLRGRNDTNANVWCSGSGKHWMYYDVTDLVNAGAVNTATTTKINETAGAFDGRVYGIVLVVVYEGGDDPKDIRYWINDGSDGLNDQHNAGTTDFAGSVGGSVTDAELTMVHLTAYEPSCNDCLQFNDNVLDTSMVTSNTFELNSWDVAGHVETSGNLADASYSRGEDGYVNVCNAILVLEKWVTLADPDLNVTEITPNCGGYLFGKESNEICAKIKNIGEVDAGAFNVRFVIDGFSTEVGIAGLAAGANTTVCIIDTTIRNAGDSVTITVTADCDGEVTESDETNNVLALTKTVLNNGYKGKRYTGGSDINTWATFELNGNLIYSLGDSYYLSSYSYPDWTEYNAGWTTGDLPIPGTATIETARLFVPYTWDKVGVMPASVSMSFNGNPQTLDAHYSDEKDWGTSYPYGMLVYDVTADFDTSGNAATLTNSYLGGGGVSMRGMLLGVVYADSSEPERTILMNEEFDLLYGGASKCTTPEEATAYAPFGSIDTTEVQQATLITVAPGAGPNEGDLGFNTQMWDNVWNFVGTGTPEPQIGIAETDVTSYLQAADNEAYFRSSADYMEASNAFLILEMKPKPDLNVTEITPNCGGYLFGKESNEICAKIKNIGEVDAGAFNVRFVIDGFSTEVGIAGLAAGANTTVCIIDTTIRNAGDSVTITVTADCDGEVTESDETNNVLALTKTVLNNGYKGKRYTGGSDINTWATFELNGNLIYSLGDSYYLSSYSYPDWTEYNAGWDASELPIPGTATIETARLFVPYTWDKVGVMPASVSMSFNGNLQTLDAHYSDEKDWGTSYPYGMLVYDVTADFDTSGNAATLTNSYLGGGGVSMRGMLLGVVYADSSEPERTILMNEEFDLLYGGASKCTTPEEATAYAPFGSIDTTEVQQATLITVAPGAGPNEGDLGFNTQMWDNVWNFVGTGTPEPQIGIAETDVTSYLQAADNEAYFRSSADYMEASNAFLILEMKPKPDLNVTEITPNCGGYLFGKESNEICAKIKNIGEVDAGAFNVRFVIDGFSTEVGIAGLAAGANTTVCIIDTTIRNAGDSVTITVTADCDGEVTESDETNNVLALTKTVLNNGYKGKRYTGGSDINTWATFELNGNLIYSLGDSYYLSSYSYPDWTEYNAGWDASELPIPGTATIETARLFVPYTWDKVGVMPASVSMSFNGNLQTLDAHYSDEKDWGTSYPYGMLVYDVTADFDTSGNAATLTNSYLGGGGVSMRGMLLGVVYADSSEPERTILMNEEFDLLYGGASKCTTPEEATAYAPFGSIDTTEVQQATLITVAPGAGPNEGDLGFNTQMWDNVWNFVGTGTPEPQIGIAETDVTSYLQAADNEAYFRSSADYMEASNAFLILEMKPKPDLNVTEITTNCGGYLFGKESNEICAKIKNIGEVDAGAFNVRFVIDGFSTEVGIAGLAAGANTTVCIIDTTIRNAGDSVTITVTADCDGEVTESDETNNVLALTKTVLNNGYKGKRYTGGSDINTWATFALHGKLKYSLGDSYYLSSYSYPDWTEYNAGWDASELPIPGTATIETARLFVPYTWDKVGVMPTYAAMSFNGNLQTPDAHYSDEKSWGSSYPYGMLVYDVTADFETSGNAATLTNSYLGGGGVSMRGMLLVVVYADDSGPELTIIMNEGFDLLYGGESKCTTPEEATAYAPFGTIDTTDVQQAKLITVAPGAGPDEGDLGFNTQMWDNVWNFVGTGTPTPQIGIAVTDVTAYLQADDNEAYFRSSADYMEASNAFLILKKGPKPDLNVTEITPNCGYLFASESNEICAKIENIGAGDAGAFNVRFDVDGFSTEVTIAGLAAGENTTVCISDTTIRNAGDLVTITVTADCDGEVTESDELNNVLTQDITVVNNGYKGKRYTGGSDINTWDTFELNGNLIYSLGDSYYLSAYSYPDWTEYNAGWDASELPIPGTATIETARLFVPYTWDKVGVMPASVSMSFNGNLQTPDAHYSDEKSWGSSYPYGMLVYDVTADFEVSGNAATLTNSYLGGGGVSMRGMLLVVLYADSSEPERKILMNEEFDLLYGGASKCTTPEEATAYAPFGSIDTTEVQQATLITVAPGAGPDEGELGFNTQMWDNVWNFVGSTQIGIAETDVTAYLQADNNEAYFRSSADYMEASNAFLILEKKEVPCPAKYAVYQANVIYPEKPLNKLRALRDNKLDDRYVTRYYDYSPALTMVLSRADPDLVKDGAQLLSRYSLPVGLHVQGMDVGTVITKQDVEEALSFTDRLKREVMKNRDAIGVESTEAIIEFIDEFKGQVKASEGKTFSAALKSSIYYEDERSRVYQEIEEK